MNRSPNGTPGVGLPYSAVIIGALVKALDLDHGILKNRTARRFFSGKPVSAHSRAEIFEALGNTTVKLGIVPEPVFLERYGKPMSSIVGEAFAETAKRWDALLAMMQRRSAPIQEPAIAVNGFLRLVVVDLALRVFAFARLADLDLPNSVTPIWAEGNSQSKLLRGLVKDAGFTREQLADRLKISDRSVDNWLDGKVRPTRKNVVTLAKVLAHGKSAGARQIEHEIQRQFTLAHLADLLVPVIGRKQVVELSTALYRFVRLITDDVAGMNRPPLEENPTAKVVALVYGTAHRSTLPLLEDLASVETDQDWKNYIMAAAVSWEVGFQRIAIEAGLPRMAAGLAQDISDVSPNASEHRSDLEDAQTPDAEAHFNLGSYLGMLGKWTGHRELNDEGINKCKIASALLPEWDAPAVEPAIILVNIGAYKEALQELKRAKSILPSETPHLQYGFGYTLMMLKRYDEALVHLKEVLKAKPGYALALRDAARCSFKLGDQKNGVRYAKQARQFGDPVEYDLWRNGTYSKRKPRGKVN